jgi:hypothetical protein
VRVGQSQGAVVAGDGAELGGPIRIRGVYLELGDDRLSDAVEQGGLVRRVPVEDHRVAAQGAGEAAHGQRVGPVPVDDLQRGGQHYVPGDRGVPAAVGVAGGGAGRRWGHRCSTFPGEAGPVIWFAVNNVDLQCTSTMLTLPGRRRLLNVTT